MPARPATPPLRAADRGPGWSYRPDERPPSCFGPPQPGVATPLLDHVAFLALDLALRRRDALRAVLAAWTATGERLMRAAPGEVHVTVGLGPSLFGAADPLGLAPARPRALRELPPFPGDALDPAACGGDLALQCCATEPAAARAAAEEMTAA